MSFSDEFEAELTTDRDRGLTQRVQCDRVIVRTKQPVECRPAGVHPPRHLRFRKVFSFMAASTSRAGTRLIAAALTSSQILSSRNQRSKDDLMFFFFIGSGEQRNKKPV